MNKNILIIPTFLILSILLFSITPSVNAIETGIVLTNATTSINASNIATDGTSIFINTWGKYRTDALVYGSFINGALELHSPIKYNTTSGAYSDYSGSIPYDNYGSFPVNTVQFPLLGFEASYIKTTNFEYMVQKFQTNFGYDDIKLYYKNTTVGWTQIATPFAGYSPSGSGKWINYLGHNKIGNDDYIAFEYSSGAVQNYSIFNLSGTTTLAKIANTTFAYGSVGITHPESLKKLRPSSADSKYLIFGTYKIDVNAHTYTNISTNCEYSDAWYSTVDDVYYEICNNKLYKSILSTGNVKASSVEISSLGLCDSLTDLVPSLYAIDCTNSTNCLVGGKYIYNASSYSFLTLTNGYYCVDVYSNANTDVLNAQVNSITHIGDMFYYGGINMFGYYGTSANLTTQDTIPLCVNNNYLCAHPINNAICNIGDETYCSLGCINLLVDNTSNEVYQNTFDSCDIIYNNVTTKTFDCNTLDVNFKLFTNSNPYLTLPWAQCGLSSNTYTLSSSTCDDTSLQEVIDANPTHDFYSQGVCDNGICTNDCNILGYQDCDSMTSFKRCGNYDTDNCLEYNTGYSCLAGQICSVGTCVSNTGIGLTNNTAFTVTPYSVSSDITNYVVDAVNKRVSVTTYNYLHQQGFSINSNANVSYSSRTCDYKEVLKDNNNIIQAITNETSIALTTLGVTGQVKLSVLPVDLTNTTIIFRDSIGNDVNQLTFIRNVSNKELCSYQYANNTLIYCDYSQNSYDDLSSVDITIDYEFQSKTYTITINHNRSTDYKISVQPQVFTVNDIASILINSTNSTKLSYQTLTYTQPIGFSTTLRGNYNFLQCPYTQAGTYTVRTYNNHNGISDFTNYYDYKVTMVALGVGSGVVADANDTANDKLTSKEKKVLWAYGLTIGIAFLLSALIGILTRHNNNVGGIVLLTFLISIGVGLVLFGSIGWISSIFAIILALVDVIFIVVAFKMLFFSTTN